MTEVSNDVIQVKADGQLFAPPLDVSALSEQQVLDLLRRIDNTRGRQKEIGKSLQDAEEHLLLASRLIGNARSFALDPGHGTRLEECRELALALHRKLQDAYEPTRRHLPWERYE